MKKSTTLLNLLALVLVLCASVHGALAYFTSYTAALGGHTLYLGDEEIISEKVSNWTKHVSISSAPDSVPVYVRARAFSGSEYPISYLPSDGWTAGSDGYYYYGPILYGGQSSSELFVHVDKVPEDVLEGDSFQVIVIYETTPVLYREDGTPYADWSRVLDKGGNG